MQSAIDYIEVPVQRNECKELAHDIPAYFVRIYVLVRQELRGNLYEFCIANYGWRSILGSRQTRGS